MADTEQTRADLADPSADGADGASRVPSPAPAPTGGTPVPTPAPVPTGTPAA